MVEWRTSRNGGPHLYLLYCGALSLCKKARFDRTYKKETRAYTHYRLVKMGVTAVTQVTLSLLSKAIFDFV